MVIPQNKIEKPTESTMKKQFNYSCCSLHHRTPLWPYFDTITAPQRAAVELVSLLGFVDGSRNGACFLRKLMLTWMQWWLLPRSFSGGSCLWNCQI
ncbi:uncharacterized protein [Henckelia pumila]|uniref:uncharacterized protein isoform X4 n=1 Tax=Henckelia pumila TaxID=405737 RepID=UPI003C6E1390